MRTELAAAALLFALAASSAQPSFTAPGADAGIATSRDALTAEAAAQRLSGDTDAEEKTLLRLHQQDPNDRIPLVRLAQLHAEIGDASALEEDARALLAIDPHDAGAHLLLAQRKGARGDVLGQLDELDAAARGTTHSDAPEAVQHAQADRAALRARLLLPETPLAATSIQQLHAAAAQLLNRAYAARLKLAPKLRGTLSLKVRVSDSGSAEAVELTRDGLRDPALSATIMAALKEASYPPGQRTLTFKFDLAPPHSKRH